MANKRMKLASLNRKNLKEIEPSHTDLINEIKKLSDVNIDEHKELKDSVSVFAVAADDIKNNTKETIDVLQLLRKDNNAHHEIIASLHKDSAEHLQLISGKKQVPLSIFAIVTVLLCGLLVASEARYSGLDVEISTTGIHVSKGHSNSSAKQ